jgi:hypothetical protein
MKIPLSRDSWLGLGLFLLLMVVTVVAAIQQMGSEGMPRLSSLSSSSDGARALWLWLDELDYPVSQEALSNFQPPPDTRLIFLLEPSYGITEEEWEVLDTWVEAGGTLILAGEDLLTVRAIRHYDFDLDYSAGLAQSLTTQTPLWLSPPGGPAYLQAHAHLQSERDDFVTHLADEKGPVILSFEQGQGRVILSATPFPFSNAGLKEAGNPALVLNLVSMVEQPGLIWFDEWHHGLRATRTEVIGPTDWLRYTPSGRSFLYVATIIFIAIVLRGRHFGRPVPLPQDTSRRAPLEYIAAIANLNRRARHRSAVLSQYHHWLKRGLGQRYRLNPTLADDDYLAQLSRFNPRLDIEALRRLLAQLRQKQVTENELVRLAEEVATWLEK